MMGLEHLPVKATLPKSRSKIYLLILTGILLGLYQLLQTFLGTSKTDSIFPSLA